MNLLAIDTSTPTCVLGLKTGSATLTTRETLGRDTSRHVLLLVEALLEAAKLTPANLDAVAFGQGPGSFTGLRIAVGIAQGFGFAHNLPLLPVSTLASLARYGARVTEAERVVVAQHARQSEYFFGEYERAGTSVRLVGRERILDAAIDGPLADPGLVRAGIGDGWVEGNPLLAALGVTPVFLDAEGSPFAEDVLALAAELLAAGGGIDAAQAEPRYLRETVATRPKP